MKNHRPPLFHWKGMFGRNSGLLRPFSFFPAIV